MTGGQADIAERIVARDEQHTQLVVAEAPERVAIAVGQHDTAVDPALGGDGDAGCRERLNVAVDRPHRHFEPLRQHCGRQLPVMLQLEQHGKQAVEFHRRRIPDIGCQV
jgi:hypothetical protein